MLDNEFNIYALRTVAEKPIRLKRKEDRDAETAAQIADRLTGAGPRGENDEHVFEIVMRRAKVKKAQAETEGRDMGAHEFVFLAQIDHKNDGRFIMEFGVDKVRPDFTGYTVMNSICHDEWPANFVSKKAMKGPARMNTPVDYVLGYFARHAPTYGTFPIKVTDKKTKKVEFHARPGVVAR